LAFGDVTELRGRVPVFGTLLVPSIKPCHAVDVADAGRPAVVAMLLAIGAFWIIGTATKGVQIWNHLTVGLADPPKADETDDETLRTRHRCEGCAPFDIGESYHV
jgi:hypothetical protein